MTDNQYQEFVEFLAERFGTVDRSFDAIDRRFEGIDRRFDAIDRRFDAIDGRFDALEGRTVAVEVGLESLRAEVRLVAEGVTTNGARLDRLETSVAGLHERFELAEQRALARHDDHEERIRAIENRR